MSFLGNLLGSFTGSSAQKKLDAANQQATNALNQGRADATKYTQQGYDQAQGYLQPYAEGGRRSQDMYWNALGINGPQAQSQFYDQYQASPMLGYLQKQAAQRAAAQGAGPSSGVYAAAQTRVGAENLNNYLAMLQGQAGQGAQFAGQQSQNAMGFGNNMANIAGGFAQQQAGNAINYGNASAQNANTFANNLLGLGSLGVSAFGAFKGVPTGGANSLNRLGFASPSQRA